MSVWVVPLAVAGIGALVLLLAARSATSAVAPITASVTRVSRELTPLIGSLRRELSHAAGQRRPEDRSTRQ